jgi:hypothetical protein
MEFIKIDVSQFPKRKPRAESAFAFLRKMQVGDAIPLRSLGFKVSTMQVAAVRLRRSEPAFAGASWRVMDWGENEVFVRVA